MKKYLLFIVEGNNDRREIQAILRAAGGQAFLDSYTDVYHVHKGDITAEKDSTDKTIIGKLNKLILAWRKGNEPPFQRISTSDVKKIVHIIDTDGTFIPDQALVESDYGRFQYFDRSIEFMNRNTLIERNHRKAKVIRKLLETKIIDNIPYEVFFVSCNMDHVLFNERNPSQNDKDQNSRIFSIQCKRRDDLCNNIYLDGVCASGTFEDSWNMIQDGYNSLARHTNLNLLLESIMSQ